MRALISLGIAIVLVATVAAVRETRANRVSEFSSVEVGAREWARLGLGQSVGLGVKQNGVQVAVLGYLADETQTTVALKISGQGIADVFTGGGVTLQDATGERLRVIAGSTDPLDRSLRTLVFPPLRPKAGEVELAIDVLYVADGTRDLPEQRRGSWKIRFPFNGAILPAKVLLVASAAESVRQFGSGSIVLERILQVPSGTVVEGRVEGYGFDEIPNFQLRGLLRQGGRDIEPIQLRGGFGEQRERFTMRFPPVEGTFEIVIVPWTRPGLAEESPSSALLMDRLRSTEAVWALTAAAWAP